MSQFESLTAMPPGRTLQCAYDWTARPLPAIFHYSADRDEPAHVHVERDDKVAKVWLDPVVLARSGGFGRKEIFEVIELVSRNQESILRSWNEFFGR